MPPAFDEYLYIILIRFPRGLYSRTSADDDKFRLLVVDCTRVSWKRRTQKLRYRESVQRWNDFEQYATDDEIFCFVFNLSRLIKFRAFYSELGGKKSAFCRWLKKKNLVYDRSIGVYGENFNAI